MLSQTSTSAPCPPGATSAPTAASTSPEASSAAAPRPDTGWLPTAATAKVSWRGSPGCSGCAWGWGALQCWGPRPGSNRRGGCASWTPGPHPRPECIQEGEGRPLHLRCVRGPHVPWSPTPVPPQHPMLREFQAPHPALSVPEGGWDRGWQSSGRRPPGRKQEVYAPKTPFCSTVYSFSLSLSHSTNSCCGPDPARC